MKRILFFITALLVFSCQKEDEKPQNYIAIDDNVHVLKNCIIGIRHRTTGYRVVSITLYNSELMPNELEPVDGLSFVSFSTLLELKPGNYDIPSQYSEGSILLNFYSNVKQYEIRDEIEYGWIKIKSVTETYIELEFLGSTPDEQLVTGNYSGKTSIKEFYDE